MRSQDTGLKGILIWTGVLTGLVAFVVWGMLPSLVWGGFAGIAIARAILGHPIGGALLVKILIVLCMMITLVLGLSAFVVGGAGVGAVADRLLARVVNRRS